MISEPGLREVILEPVYMPPVYAEEADKRELLDETGNFIRDEKGAVIYGEVVNA